MLPITQSDTVLTEGHSRAWKHTVITVVRLMSDHNVILTVTAMFDRWYLCVVDRLAYLTFEKQFHDKD